MNLTSMEVALIRSFTAIPLHALCGVIMGFYFGMYAFVSGGKNLSLALIVPYVIHGSYNFLVSFPNYYYLGVLLASMVFLALGIGFVNSFLPSLLSLYISKKNQGAVMGFYESIGSISRVIGPIVAYALVIDTPRIGYFGFAVVLLFTALVMYIYLKPVKDNN